jgi:MSHA biogenesis protein MshL
MGLFAKVENRGVFSLQLQMPPWMHTAGVLAATLCVASCAQQSQEPLRAEKELRQMAEEKKPAAALPGAVEDAILNGTASGTAPRRFDVAVSNMPARSFFSALAADAGVNLVTDPDLAGSISLQLKQVTLDEVLDVTRDMFGYEYQKQQAIYTVYARQMRSQVFPINNIDVVRKGFTDTQVIMGQAAAGGNSSGNSSSSNSGSDSSAQSASGGGQNNSASSSPETNSGARVQTKHVSRFWEDLETSLEGIIGSTEEGRSVTVNPAAGLVVVKALPKELNAVRHFLDQSELSVKRQVILETKILEVRLSNGFEAGINWGAIGGQLAYGYNLEAGFPLNGAGSSVDKNRTVGDKQTSFIDANDVSTEINTDLFAKTGGTFASLLQVNDISKLLSLLETQGDVQVLSSPRVSTVNNQKAVIRVGSDEFFVTGISNSTTASAAATTSTPNIELSSFFSGISLDVTPQIAENGDVILHVHPMVSDVKDQQKNLTVGDQSFSLPLALREIRESDSVVRAKSGHVVVLGGLMQEISRKDKGKRPLLGDVPLLNTLFKTKSDLGSKTELVILMRPVVVNETTWQEQLDQGAERFKQLGDELRQR